MRMTGFTGLSELEPAEEFDPTQGWVRQRRVRGLHGDVKRLIQGLNSAGLRASITPIDGTPMSEARWWVQGLDDGSDEDDSAVVIWSLRRNVDEPSINEHWKSKLVEAAFPGALAWLESKANEYKAQALAAAQASQLPPAPPSAISGRLLTGASATIDSYARSLVDLWIRGESTFVRFQYVLRKIITVPANSTQKPNNADVGMVYTTAGLQAAYPLPAEVLFTLPTAEWLKVSPEVDQVTNGKFQISDEWWSADSYDRFLYPAA